MCRQNINIAVLELAEIGELYKLEQKWWYDKGKCGDTTGSKVMLSLLCTLSHKRNATALNSEMFLTSCAAHSREISQARRQGFFLGTPVSSPLSSVNGVSQ